MSTTRQITLTETPDGRWTAYDTATHAVTQGSTRDEALEKLDESVGQTAGRAERTACLPEIVSDDPLFTADPIMSVEMGDETIDDVLYGPVTDSTSQDDE
jgi:hypothetical protein